MEPKTHELDADAVGGRAGEPQTGRERRDANVRLNDDEKRAPAPPPPASAADAPSSD